MIIITKKNIENRSGWHIYQLAGQKVLSKFVVGELAAFKSDRECEMAALPENRLGEVLPDAQLYYDGVAPFEHRLQAVECWLQDDIVQINISDRPICQVDLANEHIMILDDDLLDTQLLLEVITGPALVLLLAKKGVFCLHGSAVASSGVNMVFLAESGVGKSTLSRSDDNGWKQLADDILPLGYAETGVKALLDFPQLKLPNATIDGFNIKDNRFEVNTLFRLSETASDDIVFTELNQQKAMLQIIRHTVAAKLFDNQQLQRHMAFAKKLASKVPMFELSYPRDLSQLSQLQDTISVFLATQQ